MIEGVTPGTGERAGSLLEALHWADECAQEADRRGTFAVGGVLLGPDRRLLARSRNRVLHEGRVADPTAHGERQLVDWFCQQEGLPPARECLIVTSLEPCLMCTGALRALGFQVLSLTPDPLAGVPGFPMAGVEGGRPYVGDGEPILVDAAFERACALRFETSLPLIQSRIYGEAPGQTPVPLDGDRVRGWLEEDEAVLVAADGSRLAGARRGPGPIRTAVLELSRQVLPFKNCTLVTRRAPGRDPLGLLEVGAYGSSVEGPLPASAEPRWRYLEEAEQPLDLATLPVLYRERIGIRVGPLSPAG